MSKEINILSELNIYKAKIYNNYIIIYNKNNFIFNYFPLSSDNQCLVDNIIFYIKPIPYEKLLDKYPENTYYICDYFGNELNLNYKTNNDLSWIYYKNNYVILNYRCGSTSLRTLFYVINKPEQYNKIYDNKFCIWNYNNKDFDENFNNYFIKTFIRNTLKEKIKNDINKINNYYMFIYDNISQIIQRKLSVICKNLELLNRSIDYLYLSNINYEQNLYIDKHTPSQVSLLKRVLSDTELNRLKLFKLKDADKMVQEVFENKFSFLPKHNIHNMKLYNFNLTDKQYQRMYEIYSIDNEIYNGKYTKYIIG